MIKEFLDWLTALVPYGKYFGNKYIISVLILILSIILAKLVQYIFIHYFERFATKSKTKIDDLIVERIRSPLFYFILATGLKVAVLNLEINGTVNKIVNSMMVLVFVLILIRLLDIFIDAWGLTFAKRTKTKIDDVLLPLFHKFTRIFFIIIAVLWVLRVWGINITPYLAGAGILGLVLGLALQDSLKNVFGGVTLIMDKAFHIGDKVKLESGEVGSIHDIGLRSTKLVTFDNEIIYIPNGYLANSRIQNYTRPSPKVRVNVKFGVKYGSDIKKVQKVVIGAIKSMKNVMDNPAPSVQFLEMGDYALSFTASFWVEDWNESWSKKLEGTEVIYNALNKAKIDIPFPTQIVYLKK